MNKDDKKLKKASLLCEKGNFQEALDICEKILEKDYSNETALNLEGHLLYLQGNLEEAKVTWRINSDYNNNIDAKKHLENIDIYTKKKSIYEEALKDIDNKRFNEALEKLVNCAEGDFNKLNIEEATKKCFESKKGTSNVKHKNSSAPTTKLNENNSDNSTIETKNKKFDLSSLGEYKINPSKKALKISAIAVSGILVIALSGSIIKTIKVTDAASKHNSEVLAEALNEEETTNDIEVTEDTTPVEETSSETVTGDTATDEVIDFPVEKFKSALKNEETTNLYNLLTSIPKDKVSEENLSLYEKAEAYMYEKGIITIHDIAYNKFKAKDYAGAASSFEKALTFAEGHPYEGQITYMLATSYENAKDIEKSNTYYEIYIEKFAKGDYAAQCAYKLVTLNKDTNLDLAKKYAEKIKSSYSDSMFYNSVVKELLN